MKTNFKFYKDLRFLVIDDDDFLRTQAVDVLVSLGFDINSILTAENGQKALEIASANDIEFFVVDLVMPIMNGIDFLNEINKVEKYKTVPKLVLSSESDYNIIITAVKAGANSYLNKPCEKLPMAKKLFDCLKKKK